MAKNTTTKTAAPLDQIKAIMEQAGSELTLAGLMELEELISSKTTRSGEDGMKEIFEQLNAKAKEYNEAYKYRENAIMNKVTEDMDSLVKEYNDIAEKEILRICRTGEKPLYEAARRLKYETITYKDVALDKNNKNDLTRVVDFNLRYIDTKKLHDSVKDGVGENKGWIHAVQRLNCLLTVWRCYELGIPQAEIDKIFNCYAMSQEAKKIEGLKTNAGATKEVIQGDIDTIIKMMIGPEYSAIPGDVGYLQDVYSKKSKKALTIAVSNHSNMRNHMLDICYRAITGEGYSVDAKLNKKALEAWEAAH